MSLKNLRILRLSVGVTAAVAFSYGISWPLYFVTPIFTFMFLAMPKWIGGKLARQLMVRLGFALLVGIFISEVMLNYPLLCVPFYGLVLFYIYYNDTPSAPPMSTLFMTLGVTMIPIISFSGVEVAHMIATCLLVNMATGLLFAFLFHLFIPDSLSSEAPSAAAAPRPAPPPQPPENERIRLAMVSSLVGLSAVILFFAFNLSQHALAMIYICFMAGTPNTNSSVIVMKANATATCIGGIAIIIAYNLLVAAPTYPFLISLTLLFSLFFAEKIYQDGPHTAAFSSGFTTFLVLLGSSTNADKSASVNFYLRIAQVLFAGLFTILALMVIEHLLRRETWGFKNIRGILKATATGRGHGN